MLLVSNSCCGSEEEGSCYYCCDEWEAKECEGVSCKQSSVSGSDVTRIFGAAELLVGEDGHLIGNQCFVEFVILRSG